MKRAIPRILPSACVAAALGLLAACTSSQDVLEPSALVGGAPAQTPPAAFPPEAPAAAAVAAAIPAGTRVQFAPVVGAPASATTPLAGRLNVRAGARGLALVAAGDNAATHVVKGYFSAISDGGETTVIYVWDVTDAAGTRVHRIQGQTKAAASGADGWDGVPPATMETIADETVDRLASWLAAAQG
jgi:hypothetical protein